MTDQDCNVLIFDTETTGLPPRGLQFKRAHSGNFLAWRSCRIVQIAWEVRDMKGVILTRESFLINPDGFDIPEQATAIHGITTERAKAEGVQMHSVISKLMSDISTWNVHIVVAHNIDFDSNVLLAEMYTLQMSNEKAIWKAMKKECTMRMGTLPGKRWSKLSVLYESICGPIVPEVLEKLHDAATDVSLCADIYFALLKK